MSSTSILIDETIILIIFTLVLIVLTAFLVYFSLRALGVLSHTDKLIKVDLGGRYTRVANVRKSCFDNIEELLKRLKGKPEIWSVDELADNQLEISYILHSETDLEKLLLEYSRPDRRKEIIESVRFFRDM